jgi:hypothetical protein
VKDNAVKDAPNALYINDNGSTGSVELDGTYIPDDDIVSTGGSNVGDVITRKNQEKFSDATLSALGVNPGTLAPAFNKDTLEYEVNVGNSVNSITVTATANHSGAMVTGTGDTTLNDSETTIRIIVTSEDGSVEKTYTITVTREAPDDDDDDGGGGTYPTNTTTPAPTPEPETEIVDEGPALAEFAQEHVAYIHGYPDGTVRPDGNLSRAEVAVMLWRLLSDAEKSDPTAAAFNDVADDAWYVQEVSYLADIGIILGYEDGTFKPDKKITRAEFTVILSRFFDMNDTAPASGFEDAVGHWAESYINNAVAKGWITGYPDGTFRPDAQITRAQAATMINKMLGLTLDAIPDDAPVFTDLSETHWAYIDLIIATYEPTEDADENVEDAEDIDDAEDADDDDDTDDADDADV